MGVAPSASQPSPAGSGTVTSSITRRDRCFGRGVTIEVLQLEVTGGERVLWSVEVGLRRQRQVLCMKLKLLALEHQHCSHSSLQTTNQCICVLLCSRPDVLSHSYYTWSTSRFGPWANLVPTSCTLLIFCSRSSVIIIIIISTIVASVDRALTLSLVTLATIVCIAAEWGLPYIAANSQSSGSSRQSKSQRRVGSSPRTSC